MARRTNLLKLPRKRYKLDRSTTINRGNVAVTGVVHTAFTTRVIINFSGNVMFVGDTPPQSWTFKGQVSTQYFSRGDDTCTVIVAAAVVATDPFVIGQNDPAIRTQAGGFVSATAGAVS